MELRASEIKPEGVLEIEGGAFRNCLSLSTIVLPSTVTRVAPEAFGQGKLKDVTALMPNPIEMDEQAFYNYSNVTLHVPANAVEKYRQAPVWSKFNIQATTGIHLIATETPDVDSYYLPDGRQTTAETKGLVIVRMTDGTVRKLMKP